MSRRLVNRIRAHMMRLHLLQLRQAAALVVTTDAHSALWQAWLLARASEVRAELFRLEHGGAR